MKKLYTEAEFKSAKSRDPLPLECLFCHEPFLVTKSQIQAALKKSCHMTRQFCSNSCRQKHRSPSVEVRCKQCGKPFLKRASQAKRGKNHYCSNSCNAKWTNAHKKHGTRRSKLEVWLEEQLPALYPELEFHFNRKDAINSELDIYIPSLKLAFELNGIFHYEPIYGPDKLASIQNNDQRKFQACIEAGIELCIIDVSSQKYFKPKSSHKFLNIISSIIISKNSSDS